MKPSTAEPSAGKCERTGEDHEGNQQQPLLADLIGQNIDRQIEQHRDAGHEHEVDGRGGFRQLEQAGHEERQTGLEGGDGHPVDHVGAYELAEFAVANVCFRDSMVDSEVGWELT